MTLGDRVLELRRQQGLSQVALAKAAGFPQATLCRVEKGHIAQPRLGVIVKLAKALGVTVDYLATGAEMGVQEVMARGDTAGKVAVICQRLSRKDQETLLALAKVMAEDGKRKK